MTVRAKFKVESITEREHWDRAKENLKTIKLQPVMYGSDENKAFYAATPSGCIDLGCVSADAAAQFVVGEQYYVDFTPIPAIPASPPTPK